MCVRYLLDHPAPCSQPATQRQWSALGLGLPGRQQVERAEFLRSVGGQGVGGVQGGWAGEGGCDWVTMVEVLVECGPEVEPHAQVIACVRYILPQLQAARLIRLIELVIK